MYSTDSHSSEDISGLQELPPTDTPASQPGFIERFLGNFFQEKNIKWMLVVGAAIVFGSSLMLVTKAWPQWSPSLKYLAIVGYTTVIFLVAEFSRKRLRLSATYRVLQSLTLLLLPVCFLSLTWLSPGTATQDLSALVKQLALMLPAVLLLWQASTRILDHWLHGRQTTFLFSYSLLCMAGAIQAISVPIVAIVFTIACWGIFTAGVIKINRHTFWLSESHRMPRVFGFLPIMMLGLQLLVLVGTKAISVLPVQWIGFATVLVAATVLVTARSVADVLRRRTGDLVRPLPWPIMAPLFVGLILTVLGVGLSMAGFSYVGPTTYAVVPTALVAAAIFAIVARDTQNRFLVWGSLVAFAIAYQCSPVMFSDLVQSIRNATADAIHRDRLPVSLYGITYLPLLGALATIGGIFHRRNLVDFSQPIRQFVTVVAIALQAFAFTDLTSLLFVCVANVAAFILYAIAFRDRRYAIASILVGLLATAAAIPAGNQMEWWLVSVHWIPTVLAGIALFMTLSRWPDQWLNSIPMPADANLSHTRWFQSIGCVLAACTGVHWIMAASVSFSQPLMPWVLMQFCFLIAAVLLYTLRNPSYLPAACAWVLVSYAATRCAFGMGFSVEDLVIIGTYVTVAGSLLGFFATNWSSPGREASLRDAEQDAEPRWGLSKRILAFALPLRDLSVIAMIGMTTIVYVPGWIIQHVTGVIDSPVQIPRFGFASVAVAAGMVVVAWRSPKLFLSRAAAFVVPISVTSLMFSVDIELSATQLCLTWVIVQAVFTFACTAAQKRRPDSAQLRVMLQTASLSLIVPVALSCFSFDWSMRLVFVIAGVIWWTRVNAGSTIGDLRDLAVAANMQVFILIATLCGCSGWLHLETLQALNGSTLTGLLLVGSLSTLIFGNVVKAIGGQPMDRWAKCLRIASAVLAVSCFIPDSIHHFNWSGFDFVVATLGFGLLAASEVGQAVKFQQESRVWRACGIVLAAVVFLYLHNVISIGVGLSQFVLLFIGIAALGVSGLSRRNVTLRIFGRPMTMIGNSMPSIVAVLAIVREFSDHFVSSTVMGSFALMIAAGICFHQSIVTGRRVYGVHGTVIANLGLFFLWRSLGWNAAELYLVPVGLSILGLTELLGDRLPKQSHNPLRYIAVLTIICSPLFEVLGGSWIHMFSLMLICVVVILVAIGLRIRSLVYAGSAFLLFDLVAMVIRSTIHNLNLLWILGVVLGIAVIALAAFCENHRDKILSRIRLLSAELATWN